jgi:putative membrane protein
MPSEPKDPFMSDARDTPLWQSAAIGLAAGIVASFAMDRFQALASSLADSDDDDESEPATQQAADAVVRTTTGQLLAQDNKPAAGQAVHYAIGAGLGLGYALLARRQPAATAGFGTAFGTVVAMVLDDVAVPATGLGPAPWKTPATTHFYSLASHLVFGAVTEATRRALVAATPVRA